MTDEEILRLLLLDPFDPFVGALLTTPSDRLDPLTEGPFDPTLLPPIAGAAPGTPWEWAWDRIQDILRGGWDLLETIGRIAADIVQGVWEWVGGTVRFLYEWLGRFSEWLGRGLSDIWADVHRYPWDAANWVKDRVWEFVGWLRERVVDNAVWVVQRAWDVGTSVKDRVWDVAVWVKDRVWDAAVWVKERAWEVGHWVSDEAWKMATWTSSRINDAASWTVNTMLPPIMGGMGDIGDAFRDAFDVVGGAVMDAGDALGDKLADAFKWPWEHVFEPYVDVVQNKLAIPGRLFRGQYSNFEQLLDDALDPAPIVLAGIAGMLILVQVVSMAVSTAFQTFVTPMALPYAQATASRVGAALLTVGVIQDALNRGFIDEATAADHLARYGYSGPAKQAILELRNLIPSPTDLIRMAVREVFNPSLRQELTLDAEFPDPFLPWARKLGYTEEWARNYWAMHWDLPSPSQGYEMLHRGEIDMPRLESLLKALDYAPVWRQPLINIAYNPITRVDLRRLYKGGIITEEEVFLGYKAQGYNDTNARHLTDYTKKYYSPDDKGQLDDLTDLAVSTIRTAYRRHVITRDDAVDKLVDTGMTEELADFYLSIDDAQLALDPTTDAGIPVRDLTVPIIRSAYAEKLWTRERAQQELEVLGYLPWAADLYLQLEDLANERELVGLHETVVKELYLANSIDRPEASRQLDTLKVLPERRDLLLQRWDLSRDTKDRRLTLAQLQAGFRDGLLSDTELLDELVVMGYNDKDAKFLVDITDKEPASTERRLSASQLQRAYKAGLITDAQLLEQLVALEYTEEDAKLLVDMATPEAAAKERQLSAAQLTAGFRAGLVTEAELLEKLTAAGYAQADAELLRDLAAQKPEPEPRRLAVAQLKQAYKAELLDRAGLLVELLALGYTDRDAGWLQTIIAPDEV